MIDLTIEQENETAVLILREEITIESAGDLKAALIKALGSADRVYLNIEAVSALDLSCLQLLCSAHRTSVGMKKKITWTGSIPDICRKALADAGYGQNIGCPFNDGNSCLWNKS